MSIPTRPFLIAGATLASASLLTSVQVLRQASTDEPHYESDTLFACFYANDTEVGDEVAPPFAQLTFEVLSANNELTVKVSSNRELGRYSQIEITHGANEVVIDEEFVEGRESERIASTPERNHELVTSPNEFDARIVGDGGHVAQSPIVRDECGELEARPTLPESPPTEPDPTGEPTVVEGSPGYTG